MTPKPSESSASRWFASLSKPRRRRGKREARRSYRRVGSFEALEARLALAVTLQPVVGVSIHDEPRDGVGDAFNSMSGLLRDVSHLEDRAVVEFDLSTVADAVDLAVLDFALGVNNAFGGPLRTFDVSVYAGNGHADLSDFSATGPTVGTVSLVVSQGGDTYRLDLSDAVKQLTAAGASFIGVKWDAHADVGPTVVSQPTLTINGVAPLQGHRGWESIPNAIRTDGLETFQLEVDAGGAVAAVLLDTTTTSHFLIPPSSGTLPLRDDGLEGDRVAGDFIYTSGAFRYNTAVKPQDYFEQDPDSPPGINIVDVGAIHIQELDGAAAEVFLIRPQVGLVRDDLPTVALQQLSTNVAVSPHLINVRSDALATQHSMRGPRWRVDQVTKPIYDVLPDEFDFFNLFSTSHVEQQPRMSSVNYRAGVQDSVKVDWTGSAHLQQDSTAFFGSAGRLLGLNLLDTMDRGMYGNNATHELVHQWSAYFSDSLGLNSGFAHFAHNSSAASLVGGQAWIDNGDGSYTIDFSEGRNGATHASPLDLYMMGLIDKSQVPDILIYDPNVSPRKSPDNPIIRPEEIIGRVSIDEIVAAHGERTPSVAASAKDFRIGFVAESHNRWLTPTEVTFYEIFAAHYTRATPADEADPYVGAGWSSIDRFFGHGSRWSTLLPGQVEASNAPPIAAEATFEVSSQAVDGTAVGTVSATDADAGQRLQYSIISGNSGSAFRIDSATGAIVVAHAASLSLQKQFLLSVRVSDNGLPSQYDTVTITIDVDRNEPPSVQDQSFSVAENSPVGTAVGVVQASDPNPGQTLNYAITSGNKNDAFAIDPASGQLTVNWPAALDHETDPIFTLTITVSDQADPPLQASALVTIHVRDVLEVFADLKPGDGTNTLDSKQDATFEIAILSAVSFDSTQQVHVDSLRFGKTGSEDSLSRNRKTAQPRYEYRDVNADGRLDLVATFLLNKTGLSSGDTVGRLRGFTIEGVDFEVLLEVQLTTGGGGSGGGGKGGGPKK